MSGSRGTSRPPCREEKMAAVSEAPAYCGPSVNRSWMSLDLKKRFCFGSRSTCAARRFAPQLGVLGAEPLSLPLSGHAHRRPSQCEQAMGIPGLRSTLAWLCEAPAHCAFLTRLGPELVLKMLISSFNPPYSSTRGTSSTTAAALFGREPWQMTPIKDLQ